MKAHLKSVYIFIFLLSFQPTFSQVNKTVDPDSIFSKVEVEASFPGGDAAWNKFIYNGMKNGDFDNFKKRDQGICRVRFIVGKDGNVSNVAAITMKKPAGKAGC